MGCLCIFPTAEQPTFTSQSGLQPDRRSADGQAITSPTYMVPAMTQPCVHLEWLCGEVLCSMTCAPANFREGQHDGPLPRGSDLMLLPCRASGSAGSWVQHTGQS